MTENTPPKAPTDAHCASCGRFVGPYETCPYCGAKQQGRIPTRRIKIAAILLATVGLFALWWAARYTDIPTVTAAEALGTMNMAYIKVNGHIARSITYDPESGYLAFWIDDGTGEVRISAYRDVTEAILAAGHIPALGDEVTAAGTLRIREDYVALTLNVPEHLELRRPDPIHLAADELTILDEGLRVKIVGAVSRVFLPYPGLTLITLRDDGGEVVIAVSEVITTLTGPLPPLVAGQGITVVGSVSLYKDSPQIIPGSVDDITLAAAPPVAVSKARQLSSLSPADEGLQVQVQGRVVLLEGFKGGLKATLDDSTDLILLLLWDSVYSALPTPTALDVGADITVKGEVQVYKDELEIIPASAADITIHTAAPAINWVEINSLSPRNAGQVLRLRGVLAKPDAFSAGVKIQLDDGTGKITVLLWNNIVIALPQRPAPGMLVEVVGSIAEYRGELEIIPRSIHDWRMANGE